MVRPICIHFECQGGTRLNYNQVIRTAGQYMLKATDLVSGLTPERALPCPVGPNKDRFGSGLRPPRRFSASVAHRLTNCSVTTAQKSFDSVSSEHCKPESHKVVWSLET